MLPTIGRIDALRRHFPNLLASTVRRILLGRIHVHCNRNLIGYVASFSIERFRIEVSNKALYKIPATRFGSDFSAVHSNDISTFQFEKISDETLESLTEYFDELVERAAHLPDADVAYGDGVLTVKFGESHGTYVINRQTPNKQIWLSSPKSGPKRYDFVDGKWIYKHDGKILHELLNKEISVIMKEVVCFDKCTYSGKE